MIEITKKMTRTSVKSITERLETMSAWEFINQPYSFFEDLFREVYEGIDLTIEDVKPKKRERGRRCKRRMLCSLKK